MSKQEEVTSSTTIIDTEMGPLTPSKPVELVSSAEGPLSFEMWCTIRGIPAHHRAGRRAYTGVKQATLAEWDNIFASY